MKTTIENEEETQHPAWRAWLANSGHILGTTMGDSGRANWAAFRDGWDGAAQVARAIIESIGTTDGESSDTLRAADEWLKINFPTT